MQLAGTHLVLTGASSGIGKRFALDMLERGVRVTSLERTAVRDAPSGWTSIRADVRKESDVRNAFGQIDGPVDILLNNAGVMRRGTLLDSSAEDFDALFETNVKGSWLVLKHAVPLLRPGAIVMQMSSRHAHGLPVDPALYGLTKRCAMDLAELFAKTYPQFTVKILCPGPVDTPLASLGVSPEAMAEKRKIMCSPEQISRQMVELLGSPGKSRLLFDVRTHTHFLD